jgi:hypothetical protein
VLRPWQVSTICLLPVTDSLSSEMVVKGQDRPDPAKETAGGAKGTRTPDPLLAKLMRPVLASVGMAADVASSFGANVSEHSETHGNGTTQGTTCCMELPPGSLDLPISGRLLSPQRRPPLMLMVCSAL